MGKLDGKVAVITGGSTGMALAGAKLFVEEGAHVFIQARRQEALDDAVKLIGRNVTAVQRAVTIVPTAGRSAAVITGRFVEVVDRDKDDGVVFVGGPEQVGGEPAAAVADESGVGGAVPVLGG